MMLYKNTKVKFHSPNRDTDYFNIVAGVLQGDKLAPYLFIICLDYALRTSIDLIKKRLQAGKEKKQKIPHTNHYWHGFLVNTPTQAETLVHSMERAAGSIGLQVNADKTEYIFFNQTGDISTLKSGPLKRVDKLTLLRSSVLSTENDIINSGGDNPCDVVANELNCNILGSEFEIQSRCYVQFQTNTHGKSKNHFPSSFGLNSINYFFRQGWHWHWITHEGWYTIKRNESINHN